MDIGSMGVLVFDFLQRGEGGGEGGNTKIIIARFGVHPRIKHSFTFIRDIPDFDLTYLSHISFIL